MRKKDIKRINDNTYFYKDDSGVSLYLDISFIFDTTRINDIKSEILVRYLTMINSVYKTRKEIDDKSKELYSLSFSPGWRNYNEKSVMFFSCRFIDPKAVKDDYMKDAIDFISNMFLKPAFKDNKLDKDKFTTIKKDIYNEYINMVKDLGYDSNRKYKKCILKESVSNILSYDTKEELERDLNSLTDKDIIDFYNELLKNHYKTFFFGNYSKKDIDYILKLFNFNNEKNYIINTKQRFDLKKEYNEYISKEYSQSILTVTYKIKDTDKYSKDYYASIISNIFNSLNGILHKILREKYGLVYSSGAYIPRESNVFCIEANIDKKNKDKTIEAIHEVINMLHDRKFVEERLNYAKGKIKESIYLSNESPRNIYGKAFDLVFDSNALTDIGRIRIINKITTKDILEFFDSLENENIFFYVGDRDE
ncbi:MAG: insulinase family protein [Bacilli bacterium]|nr:insulinase family protein [Bacilli bacterium]